MLMRDRLTQAMTALHLYEGSDDEALIDLLTDLRHFFAGNEDEFKEAVRISDDHFRAES
jgi:hypothetical protein